MLPFKWLVLCNSLWKAQNSVNAMDLVFYSNEGIVKAKLFHWYLVVINYTLTETSWSLLKFLTHQCLFIFWESENRAGGMVEVVDASPQFRLQYWKKKKRNTNHYHLSVSNHHRECDEMSLLFSFFFCCFLGKEPRALHIVGKHSTTEPRPSPHFSSMPVL
jgi:hypothetical protein